MWIGLAVLLTGVVVVLMLYSKYLVRASNKDFPPQGQFIVCDGVRLHLIDKGDGPAVVIFHGSAASIHGFVIYFLDLVAQRYRVILLDRPGFGCSQPMHQTPTIEAQNRLIHNLLKQLNVHKPIVLGHSWSTTMAAGYALQYPDDTGGLVLMSPGAFLKSIPIFGVLFWLIQIPLVSDFILGLFPIFGPPGVDKRLVQVFWPTPLPEDFRKGARSVWMRPNSACGFIIDFAPQTFGPSARAIQEHYKDIQAPVVLICGEFDRISEYQRNAVLMHEIIPDSEIMVINGAGHQVYVTHPEAVLQAIDRAWEKGQIAAVASQL